MGWRPVSLINFKLKHEIPKHYLVQGKDIVYSFMKVKVVKKIDAGLIMLSVTDKDKESLASIISKNPHWDNPTIKISIYKNRRGRYKGVYLWCKANLGTCRIQPMFVTNYQYELQTIDNIKIEFRDDDVLDFRDKE